MVILRGKSMDSRMDSCCGEMHLCALIGSLLYYTAPPLKCHVTSNLLGSSFLAQKMAFVSSANQCEYKFIDKPDDDLNCPICLRVARDPQQHVACGKIFCVKCLERIGKAEPCFHCKSRELQYFPDQKSM